MGVVASPGHATGTRRIDAGFTLKPGKWEETNIIHQFDDGWAICEDKTPHDRRQNAILTKTCVASLIPYCWPEQPILAEGRKLMREKYGTNRKTLSYYLRQYQAMYRLMHLRCPDNKAHVCILLADAELCDSTSNKSVVNYGHARDLGKAQPPILLDGKGWYVLETRIGSGRHAPEYAMERIVTWYKSAIGEDNWDQLDYEGSAPTVPRYEAIDNPATYGKRDLQYHFPKKCLDKLIPGKDPDVSDPDDPF